MISAEFLMNFPPFLESAGIRTHCFLNFYDCNAA